MKLRLAFGLFILMATVACSPCKKLIEKDKKILEKFNELQAKSWDDNDPKYLTRLKVLYSKEQNLLQQARTCNIEDPIIYNYWHSQRLKFPSELENTWLRRRESKRAQQKY